MKMCEKHWGELRKAVKNNGMEHLVPKSGESVAKRIVKELQGEMALQDPLMSAHFSIMNNAIEAGGLYLLTVDDEGNQYCALCEVKENLGEETEKNWIKYAIEEQLNRAKASGLINQN